MKTEKLLEKFEDVIVTPTPIVEIEHDFAIANRIHYFVKRDDLTHEAISGNKWRKLKYNLIAASKKNARTLLTVGGPYSNHIAATAAAGELFEFETIGVIRGHEGMETPTLITARQRGMRIIFSDRQDYATRDSAEFVTYFKKRVGDFYYIPEGGTNDLAIDGCAELINEIDQQIPDVAKTYFVAVGSGGTLSGILSAIRPQDSVIGIAVVNDKRLSERVEKLSRYKHGASAKNWSLDFNYIFGGYAKIRPDLVEFIRHWSSRWQIPLEPVYTAKLFFAIEDYLLHRRISSGSTIVAIHSGGLQGNAGFENVISKSY